MEAIKQDQFDRDILLILINLGAMKQTKTVCEVEQKHSILTTLVLNLEKIPNDRQANADLVTVISNFIKSYFDQQIAV